LIYTRGAPPALEELGQPFTPGSIQGQQPILLEPGKTSSAEQRLHEAEAPYAPCFTLQVWDTGGQRVVQSKWFAPVDVQTMLADGTDDANPPPTAALHEIDTLPRHATWAASRAASNGRIAWGLLALIASAGSRRHRRLRGTAPGIH